MRFPPLFASVVTLVAAAAPLAAQHATRNTPAPNAARLAASAPASRSDTAPSVRWKLIALRLSKQAMATRMAARQAAARGDSAALKALPPVRPLQRMTPLLNAAMCVAAESAQVNASRPSKSTAVAAAAATVLARSLGDSVPAVAARELEREVAAARRAGVPRARIDAGVKLGRAVGERMLAWGNGDGTDAPWTGTVPTGPGMWSSARGAEPGLVERLHARPWVLRSLDQFRPKAPPAFGSPEFTAALDEVRHVARERSVEQTRSAQRWGVGSAFDMWDEIVTADLIRHRVPDPRAAHVLAMVGAVAVDAANACTDAKYHYWLLRPTQADSTISLADSLFLPNFPAYPSGHACISGAIAELVGHYLPDERAKLRRLAEEAAMSRLYAGVHYRFDNDVGLELGRQVARYAIAQDSAGRLMARWR